MKCHAPIFQALIAGVLLAACARNERLEDTEGTTSAIYGRVVSDRLAPGGVLRSRESLFNNGFELIMQHDCNLVLYDFKDKNGCDRATHQRVLWASNTSGPTDSCIATFQTDGNFVVYSGSQALWASGTEVRAAGGKLLMQNDGNLVVYDAANNAPWASNTPVAPFGQGRSCRATIGVTIDWTVPKRTYRTGPTCLADLQPTAEFVSPSSWPVTLDGCASVLFEPARSYDWRVAVPGGQEIRASGCKVDIRVPRQPETYRATLTITTTSGAVQSASRDIVVRDYLIVSIGDSVAAGEGNPDTPNDRRGFGLHWNDQTCHRSWNSGHARAALMLEDRDPHSSVTFVSSACTGDGIRDGVLTSRGGRPKQVDQIKGMIGSRKVDALLLQAGANDVGFGEVAAICGHPLKDPCWEHVPSGEARAYHYIVQEKLDALPAAYLNLANEVGSRFAPGRVVIAEYQDPTQNGSGNFCEMEFEDAGRVAPGAIGFWFGWKNGNISTEESKWAWGQVVAPLNRRVGQAAGKHGWTLVEVARDWLTHGYCSPTTWIRQWNDSWAMMGEERGTLHPNEPGHQHYAGKIFDQLLPMIRSTLDQPRFVQEGDSRDAGRCRRPPPPVDRACMDSCQAQLDDCTASCAPAGSDACECQCQNGLALCRRACGGTGRTTDCSLR